MKKIHIALIASFIFMIAGLTFMVWAITHEDEPCTLTCTVKEPPKPLQQFIEPTLETGFDKELEWYIPQAEGVHEPSGFKEIQEKCIERTTYTQHYTSSMDPDFKYDRTEHNFDWCIQGLLLDIIEEQKKQTALLDHIDCLKTTIYFHKFVSKEFKDYPSSCGQEPLNMTGVWSLD